MAKNFDFDSFARDESLKTLITEIADLVTENGNDALRQGMTRIRRRFNIEDNADPVPDFHFNLAARSWEDVVDHCARNNINLRLVTYTQGDKVYVSRNYAIGQAQVWEEVCYPGSADYQQESSQLSFLDNEKKMVDWVTTLANLNNMLTRKLYDENMLHRCLMRYINHYESAQTEYLKNMTCNQIANFLLSLNSRVDRTAHHKARLQASVRLPEEPLSAAVMKVRNIAMMIYPTPVAAPAPAPAPAAGAAGEGGGAGQPPAGAPAAGPVPGQAAQLDPPQRNLAETNPVVNRILVNAIISFCRDEIAVPLAARAMQDNAEARLMDFTYYLQYAMKAEDRTGNKPIVPMKFSRKLPSAAGGIMSLNSIYIPEIHPCQSVPPRRPFPPRTLENYYGHFNTAQIDEFPHFGVPLQQGPAAGALMNPHIPAGPGEALVPDPYRIEGPNVPNPAQQAPWVFPLQAGAAAAGVPAAAPELTPVEAVGAAGGHEAVNPVKTEVPPQNRRALQRPTPGVILWDDVPEGSKILTHPDGHYIHDGKGLKRIDYNRYGQTDLRRQSVTMPVAKPKEKLKNDSIQSRALPQRPDEDGQPNRKEEGIYSEINAQLLSMLMQNLAKPSEAPNRGRSWERRNNNYQIRDISGNRQNRDNSNNRQSRDSSSNRQNRNNSYDRNRNNSWDRNRNDPGNRRQHRRDEPWNPNGPRDRLRVDRDRTPSRDRNGYRPTARPEQRQGTSYAQPSSYRKPSYNQDRRSFPSRERDRYQRSREGSLEAKRLAQEGARMAADKSRSNSADRDGKDKYFPRDRNRTPDRRDISRDRSYEAKRAQYQEEILNKQFPEMKRSYNCRPSYNPITTKACSKCPMSSGHHEFLCQKYQKYNYRTCTACEKYNHFPSECKEVPKYPPTHSDSHSVVVTQEGTN
jgi:hypothetical protein